MTQPNVFERLLGYYTREQVVYFLLTPNPQLKDEKPGDVIEAGDAHKVHAILDRLDGDVYL